MSIDGDWAAGSPGAAYVLEFGEDLLTDTVLIEFVLNVRDHIVYNRAIDRRLMSKHKAI